MKINLTMLIAVVLMCVCRCSLASAITDDKDLNQTGAKIQKHEPLPINVPANEPHDFDLHFKPPTESGLACKRAELLFNEGKIDNAFEWCKRAQSLFASEGKDAAIDTGTLRKLTAFCLIEMGHDAEALQLLSTLGQQGGEISYYKAIALARTGDTNAATKLLERDRYDFGYHSVAVLWHEQMRRDSISEIVLQARHYLGEDASMTLRTKLALEQFKRAKSMDPRSTLIAFDLGCAYKELKQFKNAAAEFAWASHSNETVLRKEAQRQLHQVRKMIKLDDPNGKER